MMHIAHLSYLLLLSKIRVSNFERRLNSTQVQSCGAYFGSEEVVKICAVYHVNMLVRNLSGIVLCWIPECTMYVELCMVHGCSVYVFQSGDS
uniref:Secreted protein n=1 Tax=Aegilops tauschii subsp. strangulata TaxID=200361 RepID=A0A453DE47_AEGTS